MEEGKKVYVAAKKAAPRTSGDVMKRLDRTDGSILSSIVLLSSEQPRQI
jgi:hypothetical protein